MTVDLTREQRDLLLQLVDAALREIGPEIRHTMTAEFKDDLKQQRRQFQTLHEVLSRSPVDAGAEHAVASA